MKRLVLFKATVLMLFVLPWVTAPVQAAELKALYHTDVIVGVPPVIPLFFVTPDASGNGNDGTLMNGAVVAVAGGRFDAGLSLDGVNDFVQVADSASLDITQEITVEAWVRVAADTGTHQAVVAKWDNSPVNDRSYEIVLLRGSATVLRPEFFISTDGTSLGNFGVVSTAGIAPGDGQFHHIAGTFKPGEVKVYLDGVLQGTFNNPTKATIHASAAPLLFGRENLVGSNLFFRGNIDEARIWSRALTDSEIAVSADMGFQAGASGFAPKLIGQRPAVLAEDVFTRRWVIRGVGAQNPITVNFDIVTSALGTQVDPTVPTVVFGMPENASASFTPKDKGVQVTVSRDPTLEARIQFKATLTDGNILRGEIRIRP